MSEDTVTLTQAKLMSHEQVCAERYAAISKPSSSRNKND